MSVVVSTACRGTARGSALLQHGIYPMCWVSGGQKKRVKEGVVKIQLSHMDVELADLDADKAAVWRASWTASQLD